MRRFVVVGRNREDTVCAVILREFCKAYRLVSGVATRTCEYFYAGIFADIYGDFDANSMLVVR